MKYLILILMLSGCASQEAHQRYSESFNASASGYYEASKTPMVDITLPSPDPAQPYHIKLAREVKPMAPEQIKDSEWTGPLNGLISSAGMVGGIWAAGDAIGKITDNAGHNTTTDTRTLHNEGDGSLSYTGDTTTTEMTTTETTTTDMSEVNN